MLNRLFLILFVSLFSFFASAEEVYIVKAVKISATDKNASMARNVAIEDGQIKAFHILIKHHFPDAGKQSSSLNQDKILNTVAGFELADEKTSATQYMAKITVKFSKSQIDTLMNSLGANFHQAKVVKKETPVMAELPAAVTSPTITTLIIPVYEKAEQLYWFDEENSWLTFWQRKLSLSELKDKFTLPVGDLEDISLLNKSLLNKNIIDLSPLFERYDVNNIALLRLGNLEQQPFHLTLQMTYISKFNSSWQQHNFPDLDGDNMLALFDQALDEVKNYNFASTQDMFPHKLALTEKHTININFPIEKLSDWLHLEDVLGNSNYVSKLKLDSMNINHCNLTLTYNISFLDLQGLLKKHNLDLQDKGDNQFLLMRDVPSAEY